MSERCHQQNKTDTGCPCETLTRLMLAFVAVRTSRAHRMYPAFVMDHRRPIKFTCHAPTVCFFELRWLHLFKKCRIHSQVQTTTEFGHSFPSGTPSGQYRFTPISNRVSDSYSHMYMHTHTLTDISSCPTLSGAPSGHDFDSHLLGNTRLPMLLPAQ